MTNTSLSDQLTGLRSDAQAPRESRAWIPGAIHAAIAALFARIFGRLEQLLLLWRSGNLPAPQPRHPSHRAHTANPRPRPPATVPPGAPPDAPFASSGTIAPARLHDGQSPSPARPASTLVAPRRSPGTRTPPARPLPINPVPSVAKSPCAGPHPRAYRVPVLPNPPAPRSVASSSATSTHPARTTGASTAWAIRIPRSTVKASLPAFITITCTSPR